METFKYVAAITCLPKMFIEQSFKFTIQVRIVNFYIRVTVIQNFYRNDKENVFLIFMVNVVSLNFLITESQFFTERKLQIQMTYGLKD